MLSVLFNGSSIMNNISGMDICISLCESTHNETAG